MTSHGSKDCKLENISLCLESCFTVKPQVEDRIEELNVTVDKKERGLQIRLHETRERFEKVKKTRQMIAGCNHGNR